MDPLDFLGSMSMQVSNHMVICTNDFPNLYKDDSKFRAYLQSFLDDKTKMKALSEKVNQIFRRSKTNARGITTVDRFYSMLTLNVLTDMLASLPDDTFRIRNGCCNQSKCPLAVFYSCGVHTLLDDF